VVEGSVILHGAMIRAGARVEKAIVDSRVEVAGDAEVRSTDPEEPIVVHGRD
jgi:ADP-glucose pyrophosphorylase